VILEHTFVLRYDAAVARCDVCGNDYDKAFQVTTTGGETRTFDSFECAIHALAPTCEHCGCRVIGHGVETDGRIFCCAHCAAQEGVSGLADRA
jgi:Rieske Fe-S protein